MNTVANAWDNFISTDNIKLAIKNASKDKLELAYVQEVNNNLEYYVAEIQRMFQDGTFHMSPFKNMSKRSGHKIRKIKKSPFYPDRISQHMTANVMLHRWDKSLTDTTYASWKHRGINSKVLKYNFNYKLRKAIDSYPLSEELYCLNLDFYHCYESVNHECMMKVVNKFLRNKELIAVIREFVYATDGIPLGSYLSQLLINILLELVNRFCLEVLHVIPFRYMDNIVILGTDKHELHQIQWRIMNFCWYELGMSLNRHRQIFPVGRRRGERGIDIIGYVYYRTFTLIRKSIKVAAIRKRNYPRSMSSYYGLFQYCDSINLMKTIGDKIRQDKKPHTLSSIPYIHKVERPFAGKKIDIDKVVDKEIILLDCEITESKKYTGTKYLKLQIVFEGQKRFIKGHYRILMRVVRQIVKRRDLPATTRILFDRGYYFEGTLKEDDDCLYSPGEEIYDDEIDIKDIKKLPFYMVDDEDEELNDNVSKDNEE